MISLPIASNLRESDLQALQQQQHHHQQAIRQQLLMQQAQAMATQAPSPASLQAGAAIAQSAGAGRKMENRLYVGSLNYDLAEPDLKAIFGAFGDIVDFTMTYEPATGKSKVRDQLLLTQTCPSVSTMTATGLSLALSNLTLNL